MKKVALIIAIIVLVSTLTACACEHTWIDATCLEPMICSECEETQGEPLGHQWEEANCTEPKTCSICGETEGEALDHKPSEWQEGEKDIVQGTVIATKSCAICNEILEEETRQLDTLITDDYFVFDAEEFADRLNFALKTSCERENEDLYTAKYDYDYISKIGVSYCISVYNGNGKQVALILPNGSDSKTDLTYFEVDILTDGLLPSALVYRSLIMACDPQQNYYDATSIGKKLLTQCALSDKGYGEYTENSLYYKMKHSDLGGFLLWINIK